MHEFSRKPCRSSFLGRVNSKNSDQFDYQPEETDLLQSGKNHSELSTLTTFLSEEGTRHTFRFECS
jgi:hypothetical protein